MNALFQVGDKVLFGNGLTTLGVVVKVNRASLKVEQLKDRGNAQYQKTGALWQVPHSLVTSV